MFLADSFHIERESWHLSVESQCRLVFNSLRSLAGQEDSSSPGRSAESIFFRWSIIFGPSLILLPSFWIWAKACIWSLQNPFHGLVLWPSPISKPWLVPICYLSLSLPLLRGVSALCLISLVLIRHLYPCQSVMRRERIYVGDVNCAMYWGEGRNPIRVSWQPYD